MVADTGAWTLVLTEGTAQKLGLSIRDRDIVAGGGERACMVAEPVEIRWKNRYLTMEPLILPGEKDDLLGALPLEGMDLMVDPVHQRLVGTHVDKWVRYVQRLYLRRRCHRIHRPVPAHRPCPGCPAQNVRASLFRSLLPASSR